MTKTSTNLGWHISRYGLDVPELSLFGCINYLPAHPEAPEGKPWWLYLTGHGGGFQGWYATAQDAVDASNEQVLALVRRP